MAAQALAGVQRATNPRTRRKSGRFLLEFAAGLPEECRVPPCRRISPCNQAEFEVIRLARIRRFDHQHMQRIKQAMREKRVRNGTETVSKP
jgi:hypothetical protein